MTKSRIFFFKIKLNFSRKKQKQKKNVLFRSFLRRFLFFTINLRLDGNLFCECSFIASFSHYIIKKNTGLLCELFLLYPSIPVIFCISPLVENHHSMFPVHCFSNTGQFELPTHFTCRNLITVALRVSITKPRGSLTFHFITPNF